LENPFIEITDYFYPKVLDSSNVLYDKTTDNLIFNDKDELKG